MFLVLSYSFFWFLDLKVLVLINALEKFPDRVKMISSLFLILIGLGFALFILAEHRVVIISAGILAKVLIDPLFSADFRLLVTVSRRGRILGVITAVLAGKEICRFVSRMGVIIKDRISQKLFWF